MGFHEKAFKLKTKFISLLCYKVGGWPRRAWRYAAAGRSRRFDRAVDISRRRLRRRARVQNDWILNLEDKIEGRDWSDPGDLLELRALRILHLGQGVDL